jgi:UDP-glucose 4-epimerase
MATCLVLGGNGFLGSHIAEALVHKNYTERVLDSFNHGMKNLDSIGDNIEIIKGDFFQESDLITSMSDVDFVFHYISTTNAVTSLNNPRYDVETNVIGSIKMLEIALKCGVKKIIFPSSGGTIYGEPTSIPISENAPTNPLNPYAISKLAIEKYLNYFFHQCGMDYVVLRYSNPYGERQNPFGNQGVIPIFLNKIKNNEVPTIFGNGSAIRDYIYIQDALDATLALFNKKCDEKIFNVGSGRGNSINDLISIMSEVTGKEIRPIYANDNGFYIKKIILDISKIKNITGWSPKTDMFEGIEKTWNWIKS